MPSSKNQNSVTTFKTVIFTLLALIAFAANSVICRAALKEKLIDPGAFTVIRLVSGAAVLLLLVYFRHFKKNTKRSKGSWLSAFMLFMYATAFSFAYVSIDTATGALIVFGAVQITMITYALFKGYKMQVLEWIGMFLAFLGFAYLMLPGVQAPPILGAMIMTISGIGWGMYSILGKKSKNPLEDTAYNFLRSIPFLLFILYFLINEQNYAAEGILLALLSGIFTSGLGYTIWYIALRGLNSMQASVVQLLVPVLAAIGGIVFIGESISLELIISGTLILGGILIMTLVKKSEK
ncbi:DMT family transporter [Lutimonas halocynthiae]|uniref:DMT family transporter n=1 Tax=Lutimonas halocynthiae TaxID=1446477 RepID=UPI0025B4A10F|nr:DMT family transporter [Lutimonas halocynthiae]MDN3644273.1 DMT family transporter [Lutimonas halocynthiae]